MPQQVLEKLNKAHLAKVIALLEYSLRQKTSQLLWGKHVSIFKGQGMNYKNHRHYQFGDDVRAIDWKVTARTTKPYIKEFEQESEMQTYFIVDTSSSMYFGHSSTYKFHRVLDYISLFGQLFIGNDDKIGLIYHDGTKIRIIKPAKGEKNLKIILKALTNAKPLSKTPSLMSDLMDLVMRLKYKNGGIVLISDFIGEVNNSEAFLEKVAQAKIKNDVFVVQILDKYELNYDVDFPLNLVDMETEQISRVNVDNTEKSILKSEIRLKIDEFHGRLRRKGISSIFARTELSPLVTVKKLLT